MEDRTSPGLTHLKNGELHMVDVGDKPETDREATAEGTITMSRKAMDLIRNQGLKKGDLVTIAKVAGVLSSKKVPELIPLAHPIRITGINVDIKPLKNGFKVMSTIKTRDRTGVEMEAMTATAITLLTLYDMAKALDRAMEIGPIHLVAKSGGRSGKYVRKP
jgi:cyclic pyranopterin phosphate synthase